MRRERDCELHAVEFQGGAVHLMQPLVLHTAGQDKVTCGSSQLECGGGGESGWRKSAPPYPPQWKSGLSNMASSVWSTTGGSISALHSRAQPKNAAELPCT